MNIQAVSNEVRKLTGNKLFFFSKEMLNFEAVVGSWQ